jgi:hypothetical protein
MKDKDAEVIISLILMAIGFGVGWLMRGVIG